MRREQEEAQPSGVRTGCARGAIGGGAWRREIAKPLRHIWSGCKGRGLPLKARNGAAKIHPTAGIGSCQGQGRYGALPMVSGRSGLHPLVLLTV